VRALTTCNLTAAALLCLVPALGFAESSQLPAKCHSWGSFQPGAWKLVRVVTETFDEQGNVTGISTTETRTALKEIGEAGVVLDVEVVLEIAGKRLDAAPQTVRQGFHGEPIEQQVHVKNLGAGHVLVEGRKIPCQVEQVEVIGSSNKIVTKTYWSPTVAPFVLRRESVTTDLQGTTVLSQSTVDVVALDMPCKVLAEMKSTSHVKTVVTHPKGTTTTLSVVSVDIPGGVVCHTSKEMDEKGRLIRRSALELIDYGLEPEPERTGLLRRFRTRLHSTHRAVPH
jgi:hypothetical protein